MNQILPPVSTLQIVERTILHFEHKSKRSEREIRTPKGCSESDPRTSQAIELHQSNRSKTLAFLPHVNQHGMSVSQPGGRKKIAHRFIGG